MLVVRMSFWGTEGDCGRLQNLSRFMISSTWLILYPAGAFVLDGAGISSKISWKR